MRNAIIIAAVSASFLLTAYAWLGHDRAPVAAAPQSDHRLDQRMARLESALDDSLRSGADRWEQLAAAQSDLNATLTQLGAQMAALAEERDANKEQAARTGKTASALEASAADAATDAEADTTPSEAQVGTLIDGRLDNGDWDMNASELARSQAAGVVANLPGVNLADMVCNDKLCRATFIKLDGGMPNIEDIWGHPPFMNDGFTLEQEDGSVVLYYAQPGMKLDELREQLVAGS